MNRLLNEVFWFFQCGRPMSPQASWFLIANIMLFTVMIPVSMYEVYQRTKLAAGNFGRVGLKGIPYGLLGMEAHLRYVPQKVIDVSKDNGSGSYRVSTTDGERQRSAVVVCTKSDPMSDEYLLAERLFKENEVMYEKICPNAWVRFKNTVKKEGGDSMDIYVIYMRRESPRAIEELLNKYFEKQSALS